MKTLTLFHSKYKRRILKKITELTIDIAKLKSEEVKISMILNPSARIHFIIARQDCEKQVKLLKELLKV